MGLDWSGLWSLRSPGLTGVVHTQVARVSEPVSAELPGDLAAIAGRLLRRLASEGLTRVSSER